MPPYLAEPTSLGLYEAARVTGIPGRELQRRLRRARVEGAMRALPGFVSARIAAWVLCTATTTVSKLLASGELTGDTEDYRDSYRWQIATEDVVALGRAWIKRDEKKASVSR